MEDLIYQNKNHHHPSPLIDSFWTLTNSDISREINILPDDCIDIVYDWKDNKVFVCGLMTKSSFVKLERSSKFAGLRIKLENFGFLFSVPPVEVKNLRVDGSDLGIELPYHFPQSDKTEDLFPVLVKSIFQLSKSTKTKPDSLVSRIIFQIKESKGKIHLNHLQELNCICKRQIQRRFKKRVGLTISEFAANVRFNYALKNINQIRTESLLNIAVEAGFHDHAHMTNAFKKISGLSPSSLRESHFFTKRIIF